MDLSQPTTTLKEFSKNNSNKSTWCWTTQGKQLYIHSSAANNLVNPRTFVRQHATGELSLGYMGKEFGESTLTFVRVRTVNGLADVKYHFPHLLEMEGHPYPLQWRKKLACLACKLLLYTNFFTKYTFLLFILHF